MEEQEYYEKHWRKLEPNEFPKIGDVWFPGGPCHTWKPRILAEDDSLDPVGITDSVIYRHPEDKYKEFWNGKY